MAPNYLLEEHHSFSLENVPITPEVRNRKHVVVTSNFSQLNFRFKIWLFLLGKAQMHGREREENP